MMKRHRSWIQKSSEVDSPEVNLTPLIDVVFVVLISFILIAPLLQLEQIELTRAGEETRPLGALDQKQTKITIRADNSLLINQRQIDKEELPQMLKSLKAGNLCKEPPLVLCDQRASFGTYRMVQGALETAGFKSMELVTTPMDQKSS